MRLKAALGAFTFSKLWSDDHHEPQRKNLAQIFFLGIFSRSPALET
jgi:hypothetical protein